jgi:hypothetical protein
MAEVRAETGAEGPEPTGRRVWTPAAPLGGAERKPPAEVAEPKTPGE